MPSTGTPSSNTACGALSVVSSYTLAWLPERITPLSVPSACVLAHPLVGDVAGMDFGEHMRLAHAAGDQLRDLGAEVEDEDLVVLHGEARR